MTKDQKIKLLEKIINDTFWMARRYAHGRHTYAPSMVRDCYQKLKKYFPALLPQHDITLDSPTKLSSWEIRDDYLDDCNEGGENGKETT